VVPQVSLYTTGEPQGVPDAGRGCCAAGLSSLPLLSRPPSWGPGPCPLGRDAESFRVLCRFAFWKTLFSIALFSAPLSHHVCEPPVRSLTPIQRYTQFGETDKNRPVIGNLSVFALSSLPSKAARRHISCLRRHGRSPT